MARRRASPIKTIVSFRVSNRGADINMMLPQRTHWCQVAQVCNARNLELPPIHRRAGEDVPCSYEATISHHQCVRQRDHVSEGTSSANTGATQTHEGRHHGSILQQFGRLIDPQHLQRDHLALDAGQRVAVGWLNSGHQSANQSGEKANISRVIEKLQSGSCGKKLSTFSGK